MVLICRSGRAADSTASKNHIEYHHFKEEKTIVSTNVNKKNRTTYLCLHECKHLLQCVRNADKRVHRHTRSRDRGGGDGGTGGFPDLTVVTVNLFSDLD